MKNEQRFHLNRLAAELVTEERFGDPITWQQEQAWARLHEGARDLRERKVEVAPGVERIFATKELADAFRAQKIRDFARALDQTECPEGNPDCKDIDKPIGYGYHAGCLLVDGAGDPIEGRIRNSARDQALNDMRAAFDRDKDPVVIPASEYNLWPAREDGMG